MEPATAKPQQYNLKWTNHTPNLLQTFTEQLSKENFVDCTLTCGDGQFIRAHKMILSGCSNYFQQLFDVYRDTNPLIIMNGVKFNNLKQIVEFMYHGEVKVTETEIESLLALAESFKVKGLSNVRSKYADRLDYDNEEPDNSKKRKLSTDAADGKPAVLRESNNNTESICTTTGTNNDEETVQEPPQEVISIANQSTKQPQCTEERIDRRPRILKREIAQNQSTASENLAIGDDETETNGNLTTVGDATKIPRPPNAFMIFANEWRRKIAEEHPGENNKNISVHLGNMWKGLSKEDKDKYYTAAQQADREHKNKYPGYYYSPKEARMRKVMKTTGHGKTKRPIATGQIVTLSSPEETTYAEIE